MNAVDVNWKWGRWVMGAPAAAFARLRVYGRERVPATGGAVIAFNHFSWIDIPVFGWAAPRPFYFLAKAEAIEFPVGGAYLRMFGAFAVRRGESDREAVRRMREVVREGHLLGVFAEGTRQRSGVPGHVQPGAAMVALNEQVPVIPAAIHGSQGWKPWRPAPVSIVFGRPMRFDGMPTGSKGYREASAQIQAELHRLWAWLVEQHGAGRPRTVTLP
ncbi:MAG: 1-acyl-sn-glycerol-3-phosphate acyltransferase [Acidobacteriota bacterium]|nr:1-acyl-sn-glycerol-3-phosphate acyltransferase [Acidobacteriota bacterium]